MIVGMIQTDTAWEDPEENFNRIEPLLASAVEQRARLVILPEMFATGFSMNPDYVLAQAGAIREKVLHWADSFDLWLLAGLGLPGPDGPRNACVLFNPSGEEMLRYDKVHPCSPLGEHEHYVGGAAVMTCDVEGVRVTPVICYDLRFPELFRSAADNTDLFCVLANWPNLRSEAWTTLLTARSIENQCWVAGVNRVGAGDGLEFEGGSMLLDPCGGIVVSAGGDACVVSGDVSAEDVTQARADLGFLSDRRADLFPGMDSGCS